MTVHYSDDWLTVHQGDCRAVVAEMESESVHCVVTSPPYWGLRDYGVAGQLGLESTPEEYVESLVDVFRSVRRVLRPDGTVWLNLGDSYASKTRGSDLGWDKSRLSNPGRLQKAQAASLRPTGERHRGKGSGLKSKDLVGIPWMTAFALRADGWYLRRDIIWSKPNPMPESAQDRPTSSHEYLFLLARSERYHYDAEAVREVATTGAEARWDPGTDGLGGDDRHTGRSTRRFGKPLKVPEGWNQGDSENDRLGRYSGGKQRLAGEQATGHRGDRLSGFNERWEASEQDGTAPIGRNLRSVWTIATQPYPGAHFATFPEALVEPCVKAGCPEGGTVLDPFAGSGTTGLVANRLGRRAVLIDLSLDYLDQAMVRNAQAVVGL